MISLGVPQPFLDLISYLLRILLSHLILPKRNASSALNPPVIILPPIPPSIDILTYSLFSVRLSANELRQAPGSLVASPTPHSTWALRFTSVADLAEDGPHRIIALKRLYSNLPYKTIPSSTRAFPIRDRKSVV